MPDLANALGRLLREGAREDEHAARLIGAAVTIGNRLANRLPADVALPRGYRVRLIKSSVGTRRFLLKEIGGSVPPLWINGRKEFADADPTMPVKPPSAVSSYALAADIATGWLDELLDWAAANGVSAGAVMELKLIADAEQPKKTRPHSEALN